MLERFDSIAVVVAHPDDETLWSGGLLARYGSKATVICCSIPSKDPVRAEKFYEACAVYRAKPVCWPHQDEGVDVPLKHFPPLIGYDAVVTHNSAGEYGHPHHKQVHANLYDRLKGHVALFTFGQRPNAHGTIELKLTAREEAIRMAALQCYDHILPYCGRPMPKWQALLERYGNLKPAETYDAHQP